jgi:hypothetical protein
LTWDDRDYQVKISRSGKDTYRVRRIVDRKSRRGSRVRIGRPDRSLTGAAGLVAVAELDGKLALADTLSARAGRIKQRDRGLPAGELLVAVASCQLAGGDHLVSLDRQRADAAGQALVAVPTPVPTPASTTAAGLARTFNPEHFAGIESAIGEVNQRVLGLAGQVRRSRLLKQITLDIDTTGIEVCRSRKHGVACNYQGQRCGRAHIAFWAEFGVPVAADLSDGKAGPRSRVRTLLRRALNALPGQATDAATQVAVRVDAGYFAGELALECLFRGVKYAIGAKRIAPLWQATKLIADDAWTPAIGLDDQGREGEVAVMPYIPGWWPAGTACLVRRVRVPIDKITGSVKARRRRTIPKDQLQLALNGLADHVFAYSFILTGLDVSTGEKAAEVEHWYRHRTGIEALNRDAKHGAALRHLPSGDETVNTVWMWAALLACAMSAWLQEITGLDRGNGRGRATLTTLRRELFTVPGRLIRHAGRLELRLPPGPQLLPTVLDRLALLPNPG